MTIKIHKVNGSPPSRAVMMTLELLGIQHEAIDVNVAGGETRTPKYLAMNPEHTVPFLEEDDFKLGDSHAIMIYLISKYGRKHIEKLYPSDLKTRSVINHRFFLDSSLICRKLLEVYSELNGPKNPNIIKRLREEIKEGYGILEIYLGRTEFLAANHLTLADISLVATVSSLEPIVGYEEFPKLSAWLAKLRQYDWYQKANEPGRAFMCNLFKTKIESMAA